MTILEKLQRIQLELKAPKNQRNAFGKYNYRSAEDILEAVKPFEDKYKVIIKITDAIILAIWISDKASWRIHLCRLRS